MASQETITRQLDSGANQSGLRDQNVRLVLSLIRRQGAMPSADIARETGLSAQTVSNIIRALEGEGLLARGEAIKGKVGKPSIPMALNPEGVLSLGLNIGRRSVELVLVDFNGNVVDSHSRTYPYPEIDDVFAFLAEAVEKISKTHPHASASIAGMGVARPNEIWNWLEIVGAPEDAMRRWRDLDLAAEVHRATGFEVVVENDANSACVAEHLLGRGCEFSDFAYIFMGAFVGAGLVLNGKVYLGRTGNAAAIGPLPVTDRAGNVVQLLKVASLHVLERELSAAGLNPDGLREAQNDWSRYEDWVAPWIEQTGYYLSIAAASIASVVEIKAVLIDGAMPVKVRSALVAQTQARLAELDLTGIGRPAIAEAKVGGNARSVGAALLPIHAKFFLA